MRFRVAAFVATLCAPSLAGAQSALSPADFTRLHAELCPDEKGTWERIPWTVDLLAARARAFAEQKVLFMWSMNGHPLGCT